MVNLCEKYDATVIQQLYKVVTGDNGELTTKKAFPVSLIQSTFDAGTGTRLDQVLALNNCIWLPFKSDRSDTRLQIEDDMRRKGLIVSFKNIDGEILSQRFKSDDLTDSSWKTDSNWEDVFISPDSLKIADNLNSDSSVEALSARQGKILNEKISAIKSLDFIIVDSLPDPGQSGIIYLVNNSSSTSDDNKYYEYLWLSTENRYEEIGPFVNITVDSSLSETSENPVQNRVITPKLNELEEKTQNPVIEVSLNKASFSSAFSSSFKTEAGTGTVTSHTWDEIRKFIQNEIPLRFLFEGLDIATPTEVSYQDAEDGYYSGIVSTADFRREFRIDHTLTVDITDTYYPETFIFETETGTTGEDESVTYKVITGLDTIKSCIAAAKARKGNQRIVVNTPDGRSCEFSLVYPRTDSLRALTSFGDTGYALSLSSTEDESTLIVKDGIIDLSDYYTKEETNTKLSGYTLKESVTTELAKKVDKIEGKGLSINDYTDEDKAKLDGIEVGANKTIVDSTLSDTSENPVQNKVIKEAIPTKISQLNNDSKFLTSVNEKEVILESGQVSDLPMSAFFDHGYSANRFAFLPKENIVFERTTDGGETWKYDNELRRQLFVSKELLLNLPRDASGNLTPKCGIRLTLTPMSFNIPKGVSGADVVDYWNSDYYKETIFYGSLNNLLITAGTNSNYCHVTIQTRSGNPGAPWRDLISRNIQGSPTANIVQIPKILFGSQGTNQLSSWVWSLRIIFMAAIGPNQTSIIGNIGINNCMGHGADVWIYKNTYNKTGYLYDFDSLQNVTFPANLTAKNLLVESPELTDAQTVNVTGESSKLYSGSSITSLTVTAAKTDSSQNGAEEVFQFSTGTTTPTITITGVSWANGDTPTFAASKTYEIHIMYNSTLDKFLATYATYD